MLSARFRVSSLAAVCAVLLLAFAVAPAAQAAPIITVTQGAGAFAARDTFTASLAASVTENFESFMAGALAKSFATNVGTFSANGAAGTGNCAGKVNNKCENLNIRAAGSHANQGRFNTTPGGKNWLDSNDISEVKWDISSVLFGGKADAFGFMVMDPSDVGATFKITLVDGSTLTQLLKVDPKISNATLYYVSVISPIAISGMSVTFSNSGKQITNDGFGIDDVTLGVVAVPEPSTLVLLGFGLLAMGLIARRRPRQAA